MRRLPRRRQRRRLCCQWDSKGWEPGRSSIYLKTATMLLPASCQGSRAMLWCHHHRHLKRDLELRQNVLCARAHRLLEANKAERDERPRAQQLCLLRYRKRNLPVGKFVCSDLHRPSVNAMSRPQLRHRSFPHRAQNLARRSASLPARQRRRHWHAWTNCLSQAKQAHAWESRT